MRRAKAGAARAGRLDGKIALITGAAGNIGMEICRRYLAEGATVVMAGRTPGKLEAARRRLLEETGAPVDRAIVVAFDAAQPTDTRDALAIVLARTGRLDIIVNNAGSAGPRQPLTDLPLSADELASARSAGVTDTETVGDAARNTLGVGWNVVRAVAPHLRPGASVINVSTIFSRTQYYGRAAYVTPKAALNALSRQLAAQLGPTGVRVNTVFPGPIEGERIRSVFAAMDRLRQAPDGSTTRDFLRMMTLARARDGAAPERVFPTIGDVAATIVFLGSDESGAINGHNFEVTHGMTVRQESRSTWISRPALRTVDAAGASVLVAAGDQVSDAVGVARSQARCGAEVLLGLADASAVRAASDLLDSTAIDQRIHPLVFDRRRPDTLAPALAVYAPTLSGAVILPAFCADRFVAPLAQATDADIADFIDGELVGALAIARTLTRYWHARRDSLRTAPRVVFVSNGDDGRSNAYADLLRAATEELIRLWRDETSEQQRAGHRSWVEWGNQVVRWSNRETESLAFAAGQAARLIYSPRRIRQVNLYLPESIEEATGARRATFGWIESLLGVHLGKVALVTGGSAGIGGQIGRLLAIAGARVMLVARRADQLAAMRDSIVHELEDVGYFAARDRIHTVANVDVADEAALQRAVDETLRTFGRIDYLINNAGVAGAEEMVVDMSVESWRATLEANLISNFSLIHKVVPRMKAQQAGYIVNISSYFGGEKYAAVPYPNRADYAVSKAGQRALVENVARFLGPEIQVNAIAPGPVDGDRLRGVDGRAGLFQRRGKLILETRRLNAVYAAVIEGIRGGVSVAALLDALTSNDVPTLAANPAAPAVLRSMADRIMTTARSGSGSPSCERYIETRDIAAKLIARLRAGGRFLPLSDGGARFGAEWIAALPVPPDPFVSPADVANEASKVRVGILSQLHLKKMPTELEVALATVYFMADRAVSGETFQPSGGLHVERAATERELFGSAKRPRLEQMRGKTVWVIGEHLVPHMAHAALAFIEQCDVGCVALLTRSAGAVQAVVRRLEQSQSRRRGAAESARIESFVVEGDIEEGMDTALAATGFPAAVISTPFAPVPDTLFAGEDDALSPADFRTLIESNLTHHFRVARKASLFDDVRLVLVAPDVPRGASPAAFALANFVKTTLHALTATLGVENERLVHRVPVNQINLTRRDRIEEPRDPQETAEELDRFARAVLLASAPLAGSDDSRYRSRIYRGMAITV